MGNSSSTQFRRCGLCYFELEPGTPYLKDPPVSRRAIPRYPPQDWAEGALDEVVFPIKTDRMIDVKTTLDAFFISSRRNCGGCEAIVKLIQDQLKHSGSEIDENAPTPCTVIWSVPDKSNATHCLHISFMSMKNGSLFKEFLMLSVIADTLPSSHIFAKKVSPGYKSGYTGSSSSLQKAKGWVEECDSSHKACQEQRLSQAPSFPHRVLELSPNQSGEIMVRLVQGLSTQEPYTCLSHRWGPSTLRCRTITDNLDSHLECVPWTKLPKSFQEAISVTVYLGVKYIWIDSLCIIQDDKEDWKIQAAQMCNIYRGSYLTIAATSTTDSDDGMFSQTPVLAVPTPSSAKQQLFLRKYPGHAYSDLKDSTDFPLLSRGWVYQERLLSPRTLHFTSHEVRLECLSTEALCECGMDYIWIEKGEHNQMLVEQDPMTIGNSWDSIVTCFSALSLTFQSDRLPALAGIARLYGMTHGPILGQYVAGLWEHRLVNSLLWYTGSGSSVRRPAQYSGPSWSWTSTPSEANFPKFQCVETVLELVKFHIELAGPDEYGPITDATSLTLRGYLVMGSWRLVTSNGVERPQFYAHDDPEESYHIHLDYNFSEGDSPGYVPEGHAIYCLKTGFLTAGCHVCLLLRALGHEEDKFERVGLLRTAPRKSVDDWFAGVTTKRTIEIF
ncbi:unnamed protein product [Clonostachys rosea f. rosea IK726]|uniref:Heterokaryon incompatibility domain-containing protein n=2 Tax=Bionectria ochroleuca TaxID=29856 RepID=A0A0B7JWR1_BIOOC|nr:unnamed protein product [Clonostachys rosea f. rosea IK726]